MFRKNFTIICLSLADICFPIIDIWPGRRGTCWPEFSTRHLIWDFFAQSSSYGFALFNPVNIPYGSAKINLALFEAKPQLKFSRTKISTTLKNDSLFIRLGFDPVEVTIHLHSGYARARERPQNSKRERKLILIKNYDIMNFVLLGSLLLIKIYGIIKIKNTFIVDFIKNLWYNIKKRHFFLCFRTF